MLRHQPSGNLFVGLQVANLQTNCNLTQSFQIPCYNSSQRVKFRILKFIKIRKVKFVKFEFSISIYGTHYTIRYLHTDGARIGSTVRHYDGVSDYFRFITVVQDGGIDRRYFCIWNGISTSEYSPPSTSSTATAAGTLLHDVIVVQ